MSECPDHALLKELYELIQDQDTDEVVPMLVSVAAGAAAQAGVNRAFFTRYVMETIDDAYTMFTRDDSEAVH